MTREELNEVRAFCHQLDQHVVARKMASRDGKEEWRAAISELLAAAQAGVDADEARATRTLARMGGGA
jgi:predicted secreted protein